jgi:hypothetical protein
MSGVNRASRLIIFLVSTMLLTNLPIQASQGFLGLSKCERLVKSLNVETKIGDELWERYRARVKGIKQTSSSSDSNIAEYMRALNDLQLVLESDLTAWKKASNSPKCFSPEINSDVRTAIPVFQNLSKSVQNWKKYPFTRQDLNKIYTGRISLEKLLRGKEI